MDETLCFVLNALLTLAYCTDSEKTAESPSGKKNWSNKLKDVELNSTSFLIQFDMCIIMI